MALSDTRVFLSSRLSRGRMCVMFWHGTSFAFSWKRAIRYCVIGCWMLDTVDPLNRNTCCLYKVVTCWLFNPTKDQKAWQRFSTRGVKFVTWVEIVWYTWLPQWCQETYCIWYSTLSWLHPSSCIPDDVAIWVQTSQGGGAAHHSASSFSHFHDDANNKQLHKFHENENSRVWPHPHSYAVTTIVPRPCATADRTPTAVACLQHEVRPIVLIQGLFVKSPQWSSSAKPFLTTLFPFQQRRILFTTTRTTHPHYNFKH